MACKLIYRICLIFTLIIALTVQSKARKSKPCAISTDWMEVTETDWNKKNNTEYADYDAVMLLEKIIIDDTRIRDNKSYKLIYRRIRILNEDGRKWGDVEVPFIDLEQDVFEIIGRVVLPDGSIIELEENDIHKSAAVRSKEFYFDQYNFSIPGVTSDCIIEYQIKYEVKSPVYVWDIQKDIPLLKGELFWTFGKELGGFVPNYLWQNSNFNKDIQYLPSIQEPNELQFVLLDVKPFMVEPFTGSEMSIRSLLYCYYSSGITIGQFWGMQKSNFEIGAFDFCNGESSIENLFRQLLKSGSFEVDGFSGKTFKNKKVKKLVASFNQSDSEEEKIRAAFNWVKDSITNINYSKPEIKSKKRRRKSKSNAFKNENLDDVLNNKYGNSYEISMLFWNILNEMGIEAFLGFTVNRATKFFNYEARYWQFDASVVAVPINESEYNFYMPGHIHSTPGMVPWYYEGSKALISSNNINFVDIPFSSSEFNTASHFYNYRLQDNTIEGEMDFRLNGQVAFEMRLLISEGDTSDFNQKLSEYYGEMFKSASFSEFNVENYDDAYKPLKIVCKVEYDELEKSRDKLILRPFKYFDKANNPFKNKDRENVIIFPYAMTETESAQIIIPEGWRVEGLPNDTSYANNSGVCSVQFTNFGNTLAVQRYFKLNGPFWKAEQYPIIQALFQSYQDISNLSIVLTKN